MGAGTGRPVGRPAPGWGPGPPCSHALRATHPGRPQVRPKPVPSGSQDLPRSGGSEALDAGSKPRLTERTLSPPARTELGCTGYPGYPQKASLRESSRTLLQPGVLPPRFLGGPASCRICNLLSQTHPGSQWPQPVSSQTRKVWVGTAKEWPSPSLLRGQMEGPVLRPHGRCSEAGPRHGGAES